MYSLLIHRCIVPFWQNHRPWQNALNVGYNYKYNCMSDACFCMHRALFVNYHYGCDVMAWIRVMVKLVIHLELSGSCLLYIARAHRQRQAYAWKYELKMCKIEGRHTHIATCTGWVRKKYHRLWKIIKKNLNVLWLKMCITRRRVMFSVYCEKMRLFENSIFKILSDWTLLP